MIVTLVCGHKLEVNSIPMTGGFHCFICESFQLVVNSYSGKPPTLKENIVSEPVAEGNYPTRWTVFMDFKSRPPLSFTNVLDWKLNNDVYFFRLLAEGSNMPRIVTVWLKNPELIMLEIQPSGH